MKKMILVAMMAFVAFSAMAQDAKPVTVEAVGSNSGFGLSAGYVFSLNTMSLEPNLAAIYGSDFGGQVGVRYYPFSAVGMGAYTELSYGLIPATPYSLHNFLGLVGYRFNFLKVMTAHVGIGGTYYNLNSDVYAFDFGLNVGLGFRF